MMASRLAADNVATQSSSVVRSVLVYTALMCTALTDVTQFGWSEHAARFCVVVRVNAGTKIGANVLRQNRKLEL